MTLNLQNIKEARIKLNNYDVNSFNTINDSFKMFTTRLKVNQFRHINNLELIFDHPVTVISGTNKVGKTSLLLLTACSHEKFMRLDSTSPSPYLREHTWNDVISFTAHENQQLDYSYELNWRLGLSFKNGEGKRIAGSRSWSGLGKKSSDPNRMNARIRDREVRLIDLERILPVRNFTDALYRKANTTPATRLNPDVEKAFAYIFDENDVQIFAIGSHITKTCFLIKREQSATSYSSFGAASGEEAAIYLLRELIDSPKDSLILIDELEAGFHPSIQRKIADIIQYVSWTHKKQFIITTHSPTLMSSFHPKSRKFIDRNAGAYQVTPCISYQAASSKMDSIGYPLVRLYCEDDLASFLIKKVLVKISSTESHFIRLFNIIESGPIDQVKNDYVRHKHNYPQYKNKIGYSAIFDGDHKDHPQFSMYHENNDEFTSFIFPYTAPEKFLVGAYLSISPNTELASALEHENHHELFNKMVQLGLATDANDAQNRCYNAFENSTDYSTHYSYLESFLLRTVSHFSSTTD